MAKVTTSGNTNNKPTINAAKFMGSSYAAGSFLENEIKNINLRLSILAVDIRKNLESITSITETLNSHSHNDEGDGSNINENESKLDEINDILMDIGNAMSLDFANRIAENKKDISDIKKQKSKGKFGRAEGLIEKRKEKLPSGNIFTRTASKAASPFSNIFDKLIALGGILGTGILTNAVFDWFKDEENQKKVSKFFKILIKNWKWIVGTIGVLSAATFIAPLLGVVSSIKFLLSPLSPLLLFAAGSDKGIKLMEEVARRVFNEKIDLKVGAGEDDTQPFDPQVLKVDGMTMDDYLKSQPGGASQGNILALISRLENERANISNIRNPLNIFYGTKDKFTRQINYLKKLLKNQRSENIIFENNNQENNKLSSLQLNSNINFIPINLDTIERNRDIMLSESSVATDVLHIDSKNISDPYRQLTSNYYGIYV